MRETLRVLGLLLMATAAPSAAAADPFTVSLPAGPVVTMGDASVELAFTVANGSAVRDIRSVTFTINTALYNFSAATVPPSGWCVRSLGAGSIEFGLVQGNGACSNGSTAAQIAPAQSLAFAIILTGPGGGAIAAAAADVATDGLQDAAVSSEAGFVRSGGLPVWTRRALKLSMAALPSSVSVGESITVAMTVTNRATGNLSGIRSVPDPPSPSYAGGALVSLPGSVIYASTTATANPPPAALSANVNAASSSIPVASTFGHPSSGTVLIGSELIDYSGLTATSFTGAVRGTGGTTAASHDSGEIVWSQETAPFTLAPGESGALTWVFRADAAGTVSFSAAGRNVSGTATGSSARSGTVVIGPFTAALALSPLAVVSGQSAAVTMTVVNNGGSTLTNIVPSLSPAGTAVENLSTGPAPASVASLAGGESAAFTWTYVITGTPDQTYRFTGSASAGAQSTNTASSPAGTLVQYASAPSPSVVVSGSGTNTITWTVTNSGGASVREVTIGIPSPRTGNCASAGWGYQGSAPPANWTVAAAGAPVSSVTFTAAAPADTYGIPVGGTKSFSLTFACVPVVASDTQYAFPVLITDKNNNQSTIGTVVTLTAVSLGLTAYDEDCTSAAPASRPADGSSRYCLKAQLLSGGVPASGRTLLFSITSGTGSLSSASAVTDGSGIAAVYLTAPCSTSDLSATVMAAYPPSTEAARTVLFTAVSGSRLSYANNSLTFTRGGTDINPVSVATGDAGSFRLTVRNCGTAGVTVNAGTTTLAIRQSSADTFTLASSATIAAGASAELTFTSGTIASGTLQCTPYLIVDAGSGYTDRYSFFKTPKGDFLPVPGDTVTVNSGTTCPPPKVRILDWREVIN